MNPNHYQVLGVSPQAPAADIKQAYRRLVIMLHPDKHGGSRHTEDQFRAVAEAYSVLGDPGRRATYDFQLTQAARRLEEERGRQQYRPANQHVYGVPMPAPAPLRTRPPAGSRERHYQQIPRQRVRFTRRDWLLTVGLILGIVLFSISVKIGMDRVAATANYEDGLRAYAHGRWATAHAFFTETLEFNPTHAGALRRRGELAELITHDAGAARTDYQAALQQPTPTPVAADLRYRLGRCEADLGHPAAAEQQYSLALQLDSTLAPIYLARAENRLLELHQTSAALADLNAGIRHHKPAGGPKLWRYLQLRGAALAALGRYANARADYQNVLEVRPTDGRTHFLLGRLAQRLGDRTAACEFFRRAVQYHYSYAAEAYAKNCL